MFDPSHQSPESLSAAIEDMGFDSSPSELSPATPVPAETQEIPTSALKPAAETPLGVSEEWALMDLAVAFAPSRTFSHQLAETMADCAVPSPRSPSPKDLSASPSRKAKGGVSLLKLSVEGMTCHSCVTTIEGKIGKLNGVEKIKGDALQRFTDSVVTH